MKPTIQETQAEAIDALLTHSTSLASLGTKVGEKMIGLKYYLQAVCNDNPGPSWTQGIEATIGL